ncbi:MAG: glycosyltransferase family 9 protein [Bacteroidota bacterium]|jgi:ADP-heptose:LPS heptosyltransferase
MKNLLRTYPEKIRYFASHLLSKKINRGKNLRLHQAKRILVFKQDEIGDLCYSLHVFTMLKSEFPQAEITLLCKPFAKSLTANNPHIDCVTNSFDDLHGYYDVIIDLRGTWESIQFAFRHQPAIRLDRGSVRFANMKQGKHPHEVITNLQIVEPIISKQHQQTNPKIYVSTVAVQKIENYLQAHQIKKYALLHTGARKQLRKWDKFDVLAQQLHDHHQLSIVFVGDKSEENEIKTWQEKIPFTTYNTAGLLNLMELSALAEKATLYVGNESGPLHIAAVSGTTAIGLFGPGEPFVFYPWGPKTAYLHHILPCNPCNQTHCIHPESPCITRISVQEVIHQINLIEQQA